MHYVVYDSNNSGGGWWLSDEDWIALHDAGWRLQAKELDANNRLVWGVDPRNPTDRWLGAITTSARKAFASTDEGIAEWRRIVNQDPDEEGCECCGPPHSFMDYDLDEE